MFMFKRKLNRVKRKKTSVCSSCLIESQSVEECGERLRRILESPSIPQANHQLLVHLSRHLARVSQHNQAGPRLLGQAFTEAVFKHSPLRYGRLHITFTLTDYSLLTCLFSSSYTYHFALNHTHRRHMFLIGWQVSSEINK